MYSLINLVYKLFDQVDEIVGRLEGRANNRKLFGYTQTDPYDVDDKAGIIDAITDIAESLDGIKYILENLDVKCRLNG